MPTAILRPNGTITAGWTVTNAPTSHEALDDAVTQPTAGSEADGYIQTASGTASCVLDLATVTMAAGEKVTTVRVWVEGTNVNASGDEKIRATLELPTLEPKLVVGTDWTPPAGGVYAWQQVATITGAALNQTDLDALRLRLQIVVTASATAIRIRAAYVEVDYATRTGAGATGLDLLTTYSTGVDAYVFTTGSYAPVAGRPMYVWIAAAHATEGIPVPTVSGNGQTWTFVHAGQRPGAPNPTRRLFLFRASGAVATAGGLTVDFDNPSSGTRTTTALDLCQIAVFQGNASVSTTTPVGGQFAGGDDTFDTSQGGFVSGLANNDSGIVGAFALSTTLDRTPEAGWTELADFHQDPSGLAIVFSAQPDSTPSVSWTGGTAHGATSVIELPAGAATTTVGKSSDVRWSVRAPVGKQASLLYNVRIPVGDALSALWSVRSYVATSVSLDWSVFATAPFMAVGTVRDFRWATISRAGVSRNLRWHVFSGSRIHIVGPTVALVVNDGKTEASVIHNGRTAVEVSTHV